MRKHHFQKENNMSNDVVQNYNNNSTSTPRDKYDLNEALAIIHMLDEEGLSLKQIATITASSPAVKTRTVHSLRYKFKEGQLTNNKKGTKYTRSLRQFKTDEDLFNYFNVPFIGPEDVVSRIEAYKANLIIPNAEVTTA